MNTIVGHILSKMKDSFQSIEQTAVPIIFQNAPNPFNGVVFAMVGWIIGEFDRDLKGIDKISDPLHKLGSSAMIFWPIVLVDE
jgi:hypothetical protein